MSSPNQGKMNSLQNKFYLHHVGLTGIILLFVVEGIWFPDLPALKFVLGLLGIGAIALNLVCLRRHILEPLDVLLRDDRGEGNRAATVALHTSNEFWLLAKQFDRLAETARETAQSLSIATMEIRTFYDSMADAIISIKAEDSTITLFSKGAEKMFGYMASEVLGKNVSLLMPEPYHSEHDGYVKNYIDSGVKKIIGRIRMVKALRRNGEIFDIDLSVSESILPTGRFFNAIIRDITAKVRAEKALEEKNRELEKWNSYERSYGEAMTLFGASYNEKEILDGTLSCLAEIHPFPVSAIYLYDEWAGRFKCSATHGAPGTLKNEIPMGEGLIGQAAVEKKRLLLDKGKDHGIQLDIEAGIVSVSPAGIAICPVIYQQKVTGVLVIASTENLTELDGVFLDRLTDQLGVALNGLRQYSNLKLLSEQLKIKGDEIAAKNTQLEHANKMKSEFLANMSHELRTPLNAIIGFSEVLKDGMLGDLNEQQKSYITDVFTSGQHLLTLINDILDLSKIEAGKMSLELEKAYIPGIVENSITIVKERAFANNIKLGSYIDKGIESAWLDARKLKQILYNLLSNAVKFTTHGGTVSLHVQHLGNQDLLKITVTDTGIGISQEDVQRLFKPFVQLDGSASRKYEGTGLGLVMVKQLVELHKGTIEVESTLGKGSKFIVTLPCKGASETNSPTPVAPHTHVKPTKDNAPLILIVEDDDKSADLIQLQLEPEGYRTIRAASAHEGLDLAATKMPDLITLDIMLPDTSGWDFLSKIKTERKLADIPVVILSIVADEHKGFSLGASKVLQKPIEKEALISSINDELESMILDGNKKVLVVDDDPKAVELVSRFLEEAGMTTFKAYGGQEGIDIALREIPDLIMLDLMMPELSGFEVVNALKENPATAGIPIIVLTAKLVTPEDRKTLVGATEIMQKRGFNGVMLVSDIKRLLRKKKTVKTKVEKNIAPKAVTPKNAESEPLVPYLENNPLILIVEDNQKESDILNLYLRDAGYSVAQAENGIQALLQMSQTIPDLIILDLMMPIMDGFTFLDEKSRFSQYSDIPVIISSNIDTNDIKYVSLKHTDFLKKPVKRQDLTRLISAIGLDIETGRKPRILIVDDDPKAVKIISAYLGKTTYEVTCVYGGQEGMAQTKNHPPDLIVLDLMMPELNGFDFLESLRKDPLTKHIPVIILTAKILTEPEQSKLVDNVRAICEKSSLNKDEFLDKIKSCIKNNKWRRKS